MSNIRTRTLKLLPILCASLPFAALGSTNLPTVAGAITTVYANVTDPICLDITDTGMIYVGRDNSGSGGGSGDAVKIHRIGIGGTPVEELGSAIQDPDTVIVDRTGAVSGTPGALLVGGEPGRITKVLNNGTTTLLLNNPVIGNPNGFTFDLDGRLLFTRYDTGGGAASAGVSAVVGNTPSFLFSLPGAADIAVDALNRMVISSTYVTNLLLYSADGTLLTNNFAPAALNAPLAFSRGGFWGSNIYTVGTTGQLMRMDLAGNATKVGDGFSNTISMRFGADEALYLSDFVNDRILKIVPDDRTFLTIRVSPVEVCWNTRVGRSYQVQYRSDLTTNNWVNLGAPVTGDGNTKCLSNSVMSGQTQGFYQVVSIP